MKAQAAQAWFCKRFRAFPKDCNRQASFAAVLVAFLGCLQDFSGLWICCLFKDIDLSGGPQTQSYRRNAVARVLAYKCRHTHFWYMPGTYANTKKQPMLGLRKPDKSTIV